jgi:hypothetical protein
MKMLKVKLAKINKPEIAGIGSRFLTVPRWERLTRVPEETYQHAIECIEEVNNNDSQT